MELAHRVGAIEAHPDPWGQYDFLGRRTREEILSRLPDAGPFEGRQVLDFGCGAGRTLRHFLSEADRNEFWGCDVDKPSIDWMRQELCPPLHVLHNDPAPPLPFEDRKFDLIWAVSVFTHLADTWSAWMAELHRILAHDGILIATFMGPGMTELIAGEPWQDDDFGMDVLGYGESWDLGGPMVLHSPWWISAHWGRGFEIVRLDPDGFMAQTNYCGQGVAVMRKRDIDLSIADLEAIDTNETREVPALTHAVRQQWREIARLRESQSHDDAPASTTTATEREDQIAEHDIQAQPSVATIPRPPLEMVQRIGIPSDLTTTAAFDLFEMIGRLTRDELVRLLPADWSFSGKRVLDFGCGCGRTLRYLLPEAEHSEIWGCDIDGTSIDWLDDHLSPPMHFFQNRVEPPIAQAEGVFDFIYALSVFSHLTDAWSAWLLELRRLLKPDGILIATFIGSGFWGNGIAGSRGVAFDAERIGMHVERSGDDFVDGWGPAVFLSEWWIHEHWGRAFEILHFEPLGFAQADEDQRTTSGQGVVVMRPRPGNLTIDDLERPGDVERELAAATFSRDCAYQEIILMAQQLRTSTAAASTPMEHDSRIVEFEDRLQELSWQLDVMARSRSWRLTGPLRTTARFASEARHKGR